MNIRFVKLEGLGNDYLYINAIDEDFSSIDPGSLAVKMSDRHFGVGSDGIIMLLPAKDQENDFAQRIFNSDGSEAEMCGNGIRGLAKFIYDNGFSDKKVLRIETPAGVIIPEIIETEDGKAKLIKVDMGEPILDGKKIPSRIEKTKVIDEKINVDGKEFMINLVSMGNPHCVIFKDDITDNDVLVDGPMLEKADIFPNRINVEFARVKDRGEIEMRVWERGSGETLACGTGACATAVAAILNNKTDKDVTIHLLGGDLKIEWKDDNHVFMIGPSNEIFRGEYYYKIDKR